MYGAMQVHDLYSNPVYNSYPATDDYEYEKKINLDLHKNMPSYSLYSSITDSDPLKTLRVVFFD